MLHNGNRASGVVSFTPPPNFALVTRGIYRSAYPSETSVPYLRHIGIRTIVLLSVEVLPHHVVQCLKEPSPAVTSSRSAMPSASPSSEIRLVELADMQRWRGDCLNSADDFSQWDVTRAIDIAVDTQWHPVLFACPTGELQTSVVVGCLRRMQHWSLAAIFSECELFANLRRTLRQSVVTFIEGWTSDRYVMSEMDISRRNNQWLLARHENNNGSTGSSGNSAKPKSISEANEKLLGGALPPKSHPLEDDSGSDDSSGDNVLRQVSGIAEAAALSTSGMRPPTNRRRSAARRTLLSSSPPQGASEPPQGHVPVIELAEWFIQASKPRPCPAYKKSNVSSSAAPHVRYAGVRNPPAIDARSTFTKESIVEEDDD